MATLTGQAEAAVAAHDARQRSAIELLLHAMLVGTLYFLAARVALLLQLEPQKIAVFWPAAGVATGILVNAARDHRIAATIGILIGAQAANLLADRNFTVSTALAVCDIVQPWTFLVLLRLVRDAPFVFDTLRTVAVFFLVTALSASLAAICGALVVYLFGHSAATPMDIWGAWFEADAIGVLIVTPFLVSLRAEFARGLPGLDRDEAGYLAALVAFLILSGVMIIGTPTTWPWSELLFVAAVFPLLLWLSSSSRPVFLTGGIMLVGLAIVTATTYGIGHFGHLEIPADQRVLPARITLISIALCSLMMIATFAQRRRVEAALLANTERFEKLAASAPGMIYSFRLDTSRNASIPYSSAAIEHILGFRSADVAKFADGVFYRIHREDLAGVNASIEASRDNFTPWHAEFRYHHPQRGELWLEGHSTPVREPDGAVIWHGFMQDITRRKRTEAHIELLTGEVNHRANNLLAVVQAVAFNTARETDPVQFVDTFDKRISSLAVSHSLLVGSGWTGVPIQDLVTRQLGHLGPLMGSRIMTAGPKLRLNASASQVIGMALHELATNAIKYGALSNSTGTIDIEWSNDEDFRMRWSEHAGPQVTPPTRQGFGHNVIVRMARHQLDATVKLAYHPAGVVWQLEAHRHTVLEADTGTVADRRA